MSDFKAREALESLRITIRAHEALVRSGAYGDGYDAQVLDFALGHMGGAAYTALQQIGATRRTGGDAA